MQSKAPYITVPQKLTNRQLQQLRSRNKRKDDGFLRRKECLLPYCDPALFKEYDDKIKEQLAEGIVGLQKVPQIVGAKRELL